MTLLPASEIVRDFIDAINQQNVEGVARLLTEDHVFIDSLGSTVRGREAMKRAWNQYFRIVPDYRVVVHQLIESGDVVAVFGIAEGTSEVDGQILEMNHWHVPAAWRAIVRDERIAKWQVYADNQPVRLIGRAAEAPQGSQDPPPTT